MQLGDFELISVSGGTFRLDGGAMFGVVPKVLWQKKAPPDERNRIPMATNCLVVRDGKQTVLIETGYGSKATPKERDIFELQAGNPLVEGLSRHRIAPEEIDTVLLTHLHFDHAGGAIWRDPDGTLRPTFPNARYVAQRAEWETATSGAAELEGSYPDENLLPLAEADQLELVDGDVELRPGIRARVTGGHTRGHQAMVIESGGQAAVYLGDVCPTTAHLRRMWCMGYDLFPLETRRVKPALLGQAADEGWLVFWDHDPQVIAAYLGRDDSREFVLREPVYRTEDL
jgi:glyoxylase-like metal-dependent hydrolase (beta-lactamase superfamily II)